MATIPPNKQPKVRPTRSRVEQWVQGQGNAAKTANLVYYSDGLATVTIDIVFTSADEAHEYLIRRNFRFITANNLTPVRK